MILRVHVYFGRSSLALSKGLGSFRLLAEALGVLLFYTCLKRLL